jgi:hypothetical protein
MSTLFNNAFRPTPQTEAKGPAVGLQTARDGAPATKADAKREAPQAESWLIRVLRVFSAWTV